MCNRKTILFLLFMIYNMFNKFFMGLIIMNALSNLLIKLRGNESLRDVADRAKISHTYLSHLEKGRDPRTGKPLYPSPDTLKALSKAFNYSYNKLMVAAGYLDEEENPANETEHKKAEIKKALLSLVSHDEGEFPIEDGLVNTVFEHIEKAKEFHAKRKGDQKK